MADLSEYSAKRSFSSTPEPKGSGVLRSGPLAFCVQKHWATRLHLDLRLELNGVLKSWALPKGLPLDFGEKHLAVATEDHPLEYLTWEGLIPKGQYGAGEMIVYDLGIYSPDEGGIYSWENREAAEERIQQEYAAGKISFFFRGERLKGSFALIRMKDGENWLVIKHRDRFLREGITAYEEPNTSVITLLDRNDLMNGAKPALLPPEKATPSGPIVKSAKNPEPMLATLADSAFDDENWLFEPKLDGYRTIATLRNGKAQLWSRRGLEVTQQYPQLTARFEAQGLKNATFDGEIMAFGPDGKPSFHAMQKRGQVRGLNLIASADAENPCVYYAFDLLEFEGMDLKSSPLVDRKRWLAQVLLTDERLFLVDSIRGEGRLMFEVAKQTEFEGIIAKRLDSRYEAGRRSRNWLKVKVSQAAEFVVAGFAAGQGSRSGQIGSLVLGYWQEGVLTYAGNVGSGFDEATLDLLTSRLAAMAQAECPFPSRPPTMLPTTWVKPEIVVEVKFHEWTPDGHLRAPVYLRERDDLDPAAVERVNEIVMGEAEVKFPGGVTDSHIQEVLNQLEQPKRDLLLSVGGEQLGVTNLDKVYWPKTDTHPDLCKRDLLRYLAKVSKWMLRHTLDKPLTLIRFPEGINGERFYQKHWEAALPPFVETITLFSGTKEVDHTYIACNNLPTLLWLGQLGTLEFHVPHMRAATFPDGAHLNWDFVGSEDALDRSILNYPDYLAFDLDPYIYAGHEKDGEEPEYSEAGFSKAKEVAFWLKELLDSLGLNSFVKLSGKTGLHIFAPIERKLTFDEVRGLCETFSKSILLAHPNDITVEWSTAKRTGKIFMDYNMNVRGKTLNCVYSPRALPQAQISFPVTWDQLPSADPRSLNILTAPDHLAKTGDLWENLLNSKVDLATILGL